jgi:hypothetical protein
VAARARRRAGGGEPRLEEQRPAEPDEGGVLDRPRRWTPVLLPQRREILRRERRAAAPAVVATMPATAKPSAAARRRPEMRNTIDLKASAEQGR